MSPSLTSGNSIPKKAGIIRLSCGGAAAGVLHRRPGFSNPRLEQTHVIGQFGLSLPSFSLPGLYSLFGFGASMRAVGSPNAVDLGLPDARGFANLRGDLLGARKICVACRL